MSLLHSKQKDLIHRMKFISLSWPLLIEVFLRNVFSGVDIFMLSSYSDEAVAAVGLITQFSFFVICFYLIISTGAGVVIAQYNGASKEKEASFSVLASLLMVAGTTLFLSLLLGFLSPSIVSLFRLEPEVNRFGVEYLSIWTFFSFGVAFNTIFSAILRSYGYSRSPMVIGMIANSLNIVGNFFALFGPFGLPIFGVKGVAVSTVVSQIIGATIMLIFILKTGKIHIPFKKILHIPTRYFKKILTIGVPNAGEIIVYMTESLVVSFFIAGMGTESLSAFSYATTITRFTTIFSMAAGNATTIRSGFLTGQKEFKRLFNDVPKNFSIAFVITLVLTLFAALFRESLLGIFTDNPEIIRLGSQLLILGVFFALGQAMNLIFMGALKGTGDVHFPMIMGIIVMWGIGISSAWILGVGLGFGVVGARTGVAIDEWVRGIAGIIRWKSRKWEKKGIISK